MSAHIPAPLARATSQAGRELVCMVRRVVWEGEEGEACICEAQDGTKCVIEGGSGSIEEGETFRLFGHYFEDPKWGKQFKAQVFLPHASHDKAGIVKYLTIHCNGIGQAIATRLHEAYGQHAVKRLREDPSGVSEALGVNFTTLQLASDRLKELEKHEATTIDLHSLFLGRGLGQVAIKECIRRWGVKATEHVRHNPFHLLLAGIPRAGFLTTDRLYQSLGGNPAALKRQALAGWDALRRANTGNTWHPTSLFVKGITEQVGAKGSQPKKAVALAQRARLIVERNSPRGTTYVADPRQAANEENLADAIKNILVDTDAQWPSVEPPAVSEHQAQQLREALKSPVFLLTGTPGTGKTYAAAAVLKAFAEAHGQNHIAVCAPTGKAAVRITEAMRKAKFNIEATTIHRLLRVGRNGHDGGGWGFEFNAETPLPCRVVGLDESSMCDTDLMAALLVALAPGTHLMLIGDPNQLPPVGHGAPFRDLINAGMPRAHLTEIQRNSGLITSACSQVRQGKVFDTCAKLDIDAGQNLRLIECGDESEQLEALRAVVAAIGAKPGVNLAEDLQILTFLNEKGRVSRKPLNLFLHNLCNPPQNTDPRTKTDAFRLRDKVICLSNTFTERQRFNVGLPVTQAESWSPYGLGGLTESRAFVANGDMGAVVAVSTRKAEMIVKFKNPDRYVRWRLGGRQSAGGVGVGGSKEDIAHAYAITVHKSQGSEWPYVVIMIDAGADRVASREGIYTAISRASKACILIGKSATVMKQIRRAELPFRKTFLKEMLLDIDENELATATADPGTAAPSNDQEGGIYGEED